jgi:CheY-like chemotaxis protein
MSHELRTPLNAILGFANIINRSKTLPSEHRDQLGIITRSGEHLLNLINQVLDLSKIEAGRTTLNLTDFDMFALLNDIANMFKLKAEEKQLKLLFERTDDVPQYIRTDEVKLRQVLVNLLNNALKFTKEGSVMLKVELPILDFGLTEQSEIRNPKSKISFEVIDTGLGIAPDELKNLFQSFVQTTSGRQALEGTGLGLAISRKFVQLMGGDIQVSSEVGRGSNFSFEIEVELVDAAIKPEITIKRQAIALEPNQPRYRLLITDDNWANRQLLLQLLNPFGFELREASNGQEAVTISSEWQPHLIWMDMRMPVMDGYEATKQIKSTTQGQAIAVIALTASTLEEERSVVLSSGCDDYLRKPFREAEIFETLTEHIGVRFIYEETVPETQRLVLTGDSLATLPETWRAELQQTIEMLDVTTANKLIEQIRPQDAALANALADLVKNYRFDILQELLEAKE